MKHILCVRLKNWPIDRLRRSRQRGCRHDVAIDSPPDAALVLTKQISTRDVVVAVSDSAREFGIRENMSLAEARALCADLSHEPHDPLRDLRALEALARWMFRFTPVVALPVGATLVSPLSREEGDAGVAPTDCQPDTIFLDITGCQRVFNGLENLVRQLMGSLSRLRIRAGVAVAPTPGAAWALASFGKGDGKIVLSHQLIDSLKSLPPAALRIDYDTAAALHHVGIESIEQLMQLPRELLPSRFGPALLLRLDQALGTIGEPLVPLAHHVPIEARMDFEAPVASLEAIWQIFQHLIGQIIAQLIHRGCGARTIEIEFFQPYAPPLTKTIHLSRPSRSASNLFNLFRCALDSIECHVAPQLSGRVCFDDGFSAIRVRVSVFERLSEEQIQLLEQEEHIGHIELDHLMERLCVRLGEEVLLQPALLESHVPERACSWHGQPARVMQRSASTRASRPCHKKAEEKHPTPQIRPLHLLNRPIEIGVMVSPSDAREGRPVLFRHGPGVHHLAHVIGPERIAGQWWEGHDKTRDYFDVEDESGRRFWIFRVMETERWFLQGEFE